MAKWSITKLRLPLNMNWKISRGETHEKVNLLITFKEDNLEGRGEVAFLTGKGPTPEELISAFEDFIEFGPKVINGLDDLTAILENYDFPPNLRTACEQAYVDYLAQVMDDIPQRVLGIREVSNIHTSFSIPHLKASEVEAFIMERNLNRFQLLKIKMVDSNDLDFIRECHKHFSGELRIDGNECFQTAAEAMSFFKECEDLPIQFLEQPIDHLCFDECIKLREKSPFMIFADESIQDGRVIDDFQLGFHGVNIKLAKCGGYFKAMNQLKEARELGLKSMLGCMVESTLGISHALNIAHGFDYFDLDGFLLIKEDPFQLLYEEKGSIYYSHQQ